MSDKTKSNIPSICERYDGIRMLYGCPMDEKSYRRHAKAQAQPAPEAATPDPFEAPQDFQAIASQAQQADNTTASPLLLPVPAQSSCSSEPPRIPARHPVTGAYWQQLPMPQTRSYPSGSGSYYTSGSYRLTFGSYFHWISSSGSFCAIQSPYDSEHRQLGGYGLHLI